MSLSTSHTTSFLRCLQHGCRSPDGVTMEVPKDNAAWDLINHGWTWLILSQEVEVQWPVLPSWLQMGLNSSNAISKPASELECACQLVEFFQTGLDLSKALEQTKASSILCENALNAIGHFVQHFGGGTDFPLIKFLGRFGALHVLYHCTFCIFVSLKKPCVLCVYCALCLNHS